jgi:hypothetical protein
MPEPVRTPTIAFWTFIELGLGNPWFEELPNKLTRALVSVNWSL